MSKLSKKPRILLLSSSTSFFSALVSTSNTSVNKKLLNDAWYKSKLVNRINPANTLEISNTAAAENTVPKTNDAVPTKNNDKK